MKSLINEIDRSFTKFVTEKKRIVISGRETDNLDNVIKEHIKDFYNRNHKWKKDMPIYCNQLTADALKLEFPYVFSDVKYPASLVH